jgi:DNA polymerase/3'-5' exonuclease PolX
MEDKTERIIYILNLFLVDSQRKINTDPIAPFRVRAYTNAIKAIKEYGKPITDLSDADTLFEEKKIGKKIRDKMYEIILTGELEEAKTLEVVADVREQLINIYGIGPVRADELINDYNVKSLDDLREIVLKDPEFLTEAQTLGLAFYSDLIERIPRLEMMEHEKYIREFFTSRVPEFNITIVGSYRRNEPTSGDVDILVSYNSMDYETAQKKFSLIIEELMVDEYCVGTLSNGKHKYMGIVQIDPEAKARRLDILLTKPEEFVLSLLYFTGSQKFNIAFRRVANMKGYTLNEHRLGALPLEKGQTAPPKPPVFHTEKDVFDFLNVKYLSPEERTGEIEVY